jgi:hypothetical protein
MKNWNSTCSCCGPTCTDKEYSTTIKLRVVLAPADRELETISWPRGIYDLNASGNRFVVDVADAPAATVLATKGLILLSYAISQRIEGSIFLQRAIRPSSVPPMRYTFSAKN